MEPTIKYENCDEFYGETGPSATENSLKRNYNALSGGNENEVVNPVTKAMNEQFGNLFAAQQQTMQAPVKRSRRWDQSVLFGSPFFELQQVVPNGTGSIIACCLSCHVMLRGHKNVSSNFIKHMKRLHPEVYKIYESMKLLKCRGFSVETNMNTTTDTSASEEGGDQVPSYSDAGGALLQHIHTTTGDEDSHSEMSDNSGTPHNSRDVIELSEENELEPNQTATNEQSRIEDNAGEQRNNLDISKKSLEMLSKMLEQKLKDYVSRTELTETTEEMINSVEERLVQKLTSSTGSNSGDVGTIAALQAEVKALKDDCIALRLTREQSQKSKRHLQMELYSLDKFVHRRKLVVHNIKLPNVENAQANTEKYFRSQLDLPTLTLTNTTILPRSEPHSEKHNLLIELKTEADVQAILKNSFKLKNTGIFVEPDMSEHARKRKGKLMVLRKELLRRNTNLKVFVRNAQLIVNGKYFRWDEVEGLCVGGAQRSGDVGEGDAVTLLKTATGLDLTEFLTVLKFYDVQIK